jgi:hypothetical protein
MEVGHGPNLGCSAKGGGDLIRGPRQKHSETEFEVSTAVVMKNSDLLGYNAM